MVFAVDTRWHSLHESLVVHLERWPVISQLSAKALNITSEKATEYDGARTACRVYEQSHKEVVKLLAPIVKWTRRLEATKTPTMSLVYLAYTNMIKAVDAVVVHEAPAGDVRTKLRASLTKRLDFVAPLVDPGASKEADRTRFKMLNAAALVDVRTVAWRMGEISDNEGVMDLCFDYMAMCHVSFRADVEQEAATTTVGTKTEGVQRFLSKMGSTSAKSPRYDFTLSAIEAEMAPFAQAVENAVEIWTWTQSWHWTRSSGGRATRRRSRTWRLWPAPCSRRPRHLLAQSASFRQRDWCHRACVRQ